MRMRRQRGRRQTAILEDLVSNPPKRAPDGARTNDERNAEVKSAPEPNKLEAPRQRPWADLLMGIIHSEEGNMDEALPSPLQVEQFDPRLPDLHLRIGEVYLRQKRTSDAQRAFERALEIDGDSAMAHLGLARVHLRKRQNEAAADQALHAVGLQHFLPLGTSIWE